MAEFGKGDRVLVNLSAGILPGEPRAPDWQPGTIEERLDNGYYRVHLDAPIAGRDAVKEAASEHIRALGRG
jgi:hypothetical protein